MDKSEILTAIIIVIFIIGMFAFHFYCVAPSQDAGTEKMLMGDVTVMEKTMRIETNLTTTWTNRSLMLE